MNNVENYQIVKRNTLNAKEWASKLGEFHSSSYGGFGTLTSISLCGGEYSPIIYFCAHNGTNDYKPAPKEFLPQIEEAIKIHFKTILDTAIRLQSIELKNAALSCKNEYEIILKEAGEFE
jgi:hypothetical protein